MVGTRRLELLTSTVSRSSLAVTDGHSTALAATFGVVRNSRELLADPIWTQIALRRNCQFLVRSEELPVCLQAVSKGFECHRTPDGPDLRGGKLGRRYRRTDSDRYGFPHSGLAIHMQVPKSLQNFLLSSSSMGYKSVDLIRSVWKRFVLIVQPLQIS